MLKKEKNINAFFCWFIHNNFLFFLKDGNSSKLEFIKSSNELSLYI
jgi:hypothetical protein